MGALADVETVVVRGPKQLKWLRWAVERLEAPESGWLGVDTETTGLCPFQNRVRLVQVASEDLVLVVDLDGWRAPSGGRRADWAVPGLKELGELLASPRPKVLQNAAFDLNFLRGEGIVLGGNIFDTLFASRVYNNGGGHPNNLGAIVQRELDEEMSKELQKADWSGELSEEMLDYSAKDAAALPRLVMPLRKKLREAKINGSTVTLWDVFNLECASLRAFAEMQWHGFGFSAVKAAELCSKLQRKEGILKLEFLNMLDKAIREKFPEDETKWLPREVDWSFNTREKTSGSVKKGTKVYAGFNPRSVQQMAQRFEDAGILLPPSETGKPSLDQNLLAFLRPDYPLIDLYLNWKEVVTGVSNVETLLEAVQADGRIHANYKQMGTDTGRVSCSSPNLQQVPREGDFRGLFEAAPGFMLVVADFSQVELRVAAELSGEQRMLDAYNAGRDLHTETAMLMLNKKAEEVTKAERQSSKVANFGLLYGAGPATLRKQAVAQYGLDMSMDEAKEVVAGFRKAYPRLFEWQKEQGGGSTNCVYTRYGRRRIMQGRNDKFTSRINTPVQGTAGDICKIAIVKLFDEIRARGEDVRLIAQVHDELVLEVEEGRVEFWARALQECMEQAGALVCHKVKIEAEVSCGRTWAEAK